ncbi:hypothetical protein J421_3585 [Gemmatirosa kalamazoonensis]|uniref:Uncharacterized protein n=1 Tax=Gemmatirosa kalamazoonensis TaxID=861299 RepID=W0RL03_9BACT|nr:hypothetical protein [Gemmatirosa kalamazoonensis]AHG91122.1 hypothetical protein J421_3585 [Gemmatirosa kalamazoonensis]
MRLFGDWQAERDRRRRAAGYVRALHAEPLDDEVAWLAGAAAGGDADHARWEWRYARRALGLLVAQRNALDDRTPSLIAQELSEAFTRDPYIAVGALTLAERQFNERLAAYRDALASRSGEPTGTRVARILLAFTGQVRPKPEVLAHAATVLTRYLAEVGSALEHAFGTPSLPEDVPPSAVGGAP